MKNLTREEAVARAALLDVHSYDVELDLRATATGEHFDSHTVVRFRSTGRETFVELDAELVHADLDGRPLGRLHGNRLALTGLTGEHVLTVRARGTCSRTGEGLHRFVDPTDGAVYLYAQSFLDDAQRIFACFDQPDLKAPITLTVHAPDGWTVVGNTRAEPDGTTWTCPPTAPISTYLFTVAAGPWHSRYAELDGRRLGLHCRRSLAPYLDADTDELFELTGQCFALQQELFGRPYPFGDTYDQLFVPEFNAGAMENPGAVTFREQFLFRSRVTDDARRQRAMVIAHEMAHMWFGDLVTMRWWDDLWLNESFAELLGFFTVDRATRFQDTWADFAATRKAWGYRADQLPSTHPVRGEVADTRSALLNFDGISYAKGASVLRQLMATVGEDTFFTGVRAYIAAHAGGNTSFADLLHALERASGRELADWARAWLQTSGVSTLRVRDGVLTQESPVVRPHRLQVGWYGQARGGDAAGTTGPSGAAGTTPAGPVGPAGRAGSGQAAAQEPGRLVRLAARELDVAGEPVPVPPPAGAESAALVLPNDGDHTFAKLRLDDHSLATARTRLHQVRDPLPRALVWGALWDACRDAELPAAGFVRAVLAGIGGESDPSVVTTLLTQARTAALLFSADPQLRAELAASSRQAAWAAEPGSDLQLARLRAFLAVTPEPDGVRELLAGREVPPGVVLDTELRWAAVKALAALGGLQPGELAAELACDDTAAGRLHALTAGSARPDAGSKAQAWDDARDLTARSAYELEAVGAGFWQVGQEALLRGYVQRYVAELPALWAAATPQVGAEQARRLFPSTLVEPEVLSATASLLDDAHPAGLRRVVAELRADLERALRARAA